MGLVDSHCHLDDKKFDSDRKGVINSLGNNGIDFVVSCADSIESSKKAIKLADEYPNVYATVGVHPHNASKYNDTAEKELLTLVKKSRVVALGEIGLDYYYDFSPRDAQMECMTRQIDIAKNEELPIVFHVREAFGDFLPILRRGEIPKNSVMHCYTGSIDSAKECLDNGMLISFTGVITFKNAKRVCDVVRYVPLSSMMIETDSPYMAPEPYRGKRNEPKYVLEVAKVIAHFKDVTVDEVINITKMNAMNFFGIND
jgi:TatD DNase family protein